jgi:4-alpha-glucanotransferase
MRNSGNDGESISGKLRYRPLSNTEHSNHAIGTSGVELSYRDAFGRLHETPPAALEAILAAMGAGDAPPGGPQSEPLMVVRAGEEREIPCPAVIRLENNQELSCERRLSRALPPGYHRIHLEERDQAIPLIVSPGQCWLPETLHTWGWAVQLYAARSRESWGMGDLGDLEKLAKWSAEELGAGMMMLNPLSAPTPIKPLEASPYYPSSRRFFNPLWIQVESVPGANSGTVPGLEALASAGRGLNEYRRIERDTIFALKMRALELLWLRFCGNPMFDEYKRERGGELEEFATFCALAERHQSGWDSWASEYKHPRLPAVERFAAENHGRVQFHMWLQWLLDVQLARASRHLALMQDLPIGVDPSGADAWSWQDLLAPGMAVGAPPDEFNTQGQNWGLPPWIPGKLREAGYQPFIQTIRAVFRNAGGLRIDHVMGLFRLFWIPAGMSAADGAYVRYNADELLAIVALESLRAKAYVVGEDLGTIEEGVRQQLAAHKILSYRVLWFENADPAKYPEDALAAITTHDLPTVAGLWSGADLEKQKELGLHPNEQGAEETRRRLAECTGVTADAPAEEVVVRAHEVLARAPSRILTAALEDALAVEQRPNLPATTNDKNPNWSIALPAPIESLMEQELPRRIAKVLARSGEKGQRS